MEVYFLKNIGPHKKFTQKNVPEKLGNFYVKARIAEVVEPKSKTYQTRMMVAEKPKEAVKETKVIDGKEELKRILDAAGVQYDGRLGEAKLRELVESINER